MLVSRDATASTNRERGVTALTTAHQDPPSLSTASRSSLLLLANFRWLWCAQLISQFGDGFYAIALPWLVYQHTHSGIATTATLAAGSFSFLVVGPVAGVFVDRWDRRRTLVGADLLRAVVLIVFPVILAFGFNLPAVLAIAVLLPALGRFFAPAQRATVPAIVAAEQLVPANALMQGAGNVAYIAGPAVAGLLLFGVGAVPLLFADGVSFIGSALLLGLVALPKRRSASATAGFRRALVEGFRITWRNPTLRGAGFVAAMATLFFAPVPALLPLWVGVGAGKAGIFGLLTASFFAGSLAGSLLIARIGQRLSARVLIIGSLLGMGVAIALFGRAHQALLGAGGLALAGVFLTGYNVGVTTLLQRLAPVGALGRVMTVNDTASWSLRPLTIIASGALADWLGVHALLVAMGGGMLALALAALSSHWLRELAPPPSKTSQVVEPV